MARHYHASWWGYTTRRYERACELGTWLAYRVQVQRPWLRWLTRWRLAHILRWIGQAEGETALLTPEVVREYQGR